MGYFYQFSIWELCSYDYEMTRDKRLVITVDYTLNQNVRFI